MTPEDSKKLPAPTPLWENGAPENDNLPWDGYAEETWTREEDGLLFAKNITEPSLQLFLPDAPAGTFPTVLIAPGGGYHILSVELEGYHVAERLNALGIGVAVLKYRHYDRELARRDAHRALRLLRHRANEWGLDPQRMGMGGFSAGAHLTARTGLDPKLPEAWKIDALGDESERPDFLLLIYGECPFVFFDHMLPHIPTLIIGSRPDHPEHRITFFERLMAADCPAAMHLFQEGEHGFGAQESTTAGRLWPMLFEAFLQENRFLKP